MNKIKIMTKRKYFLKTQRIGFSIWSINDTSLAKQLWGNPQVTQYICAKGIFSDKEILDRLSLEIHNNELYHVQYWPIFDLKTHQFIGCCGLRPHLHDYEIGFHLLPEFWHQNYAIEASLAVINYAFMAINTKCLYAGHHPFNIASKRILQKLGFIYFKDEFYQPTGLNHPTYQLTKKEWLSSK